jgi:hypothetical protein
MFRIRAFRGAFVATAGMTFGMYGVLFLLPLTWQSTGMLDPVGAGLALVPMALVFVVVSPFSGPLLAKLGTRVMSVAIIGGGLLLIGMAAHSGSQSWARYSPSRMAARKACACRCCSAESANWPPRRGLGLRSGRSPSRGADDAARVWKPLPFRRRTRWRQINPVGISNAWGHVAEWLRSGLQIRSAAFRPVLPDPKPS